MAAHSWCIPQSVLANWSAKGKEDAMDILRRCHKSCVRSSNPLEGNQSLGTLVMDMLSLAVKGTISVEDTCGIFSKFYSAEKLSEFPSMVADTLSILDVEVQCGTSSEEKDRLRDLITGLRDVVPEVLLKERLEPDALERVGLVMDSKAFSQKGIKLKTKLFYKQQKFNLFREESEGYSKLIAELSSQGKTPEASLLISDNIKSLIGRFSLDPNRVLDMVLEAFECHLEDAEFYVSLLKSYPYEKETFCAMLGFKYRFYQGEGGATARETPPTLYKLTAALIHEGFVSVQDVYPLLSPPPSSITREYGEVMKESRTVARKMNKISLVQTSEDTQDVDKPSAVATCETSLAANQKLGLCHALIQSGDWSHAQLVLDSLPPSYALLCQPIRHALCLQLHALLDPLYRSLMPKAANCRPVPPPVGLEPCRCYDDLPGPCLEMFFCLGPTLSGDPVLLAKVVRVAKGVLKDCTSSPGAGLDSAVYSGVVTLLDEAVLPSLSLLHCNCSLAEEVWSVLRMLPYDVRYHLYGRWKNDSYDKHPELMVAKATTLNRAKYIMKRITKDNVKPCGRQVGKLSHSNPGVVFDYVLSQVQNFDNLIVPVVDSLKYLSPLGYDMLSYCIIEALANPAKERLKHEDTTVSQWLQGLATFCGTVYKKYPLELVGLLQFVTNQLKSGKSFDLLILKEVVQKMSGIDSSEELTQSQIEAMAGGELLKAEGACFSQVRNTKKSAGRLKETLVDAGLGLPLALLIGQQRDRIVFEDGSNKHVKLVGMLYDYCMETLVQFAIFLESHLSADEYASKFPDLETLQGTYHLPPDIAFCLMRPQLNHLVQGKYLSLLKESTDGAGDKKSFAVQKECYAKAVEYVHGPVAKTVKSIQVEKVWEDMSVGLYVAFWALGLQDLYVPTGRYEAEIHRQKQAIQETENNSELSSSKKKREVERCTTIIQGLKAELAAQETNQRLVLARLEGEKEGWFSTVYKNKTITQFLQLCVFPRCLFTVGDAVYCAKFVGMLHSIRTPNFSTLLFFDRIFADISYTTAMCTENEAKRYGRFLGLLMEGISRWHQDKDVYERECSDTPGFIHNVRGGTADSSRNSLDFESFRHICFKWHFKITKALVTCLESKSYQQIRNSLIVMTRLLPQYPKVAHLSMALEKRVSNLHEEEKDKRQDLFALAVGYAGQLRQHKERGHLIPETEFHIKDERVKAEQQRQAESSAHSSTRESSVSSDHGGDDERGGSRSKGRSPVPPSSRGKSDGSKLDSKSVRGGDSGKGGRRSEGKPAGKGAKDDATPKGGKPALASVRSKESDTASSGGEDRGSREPTPGKRRHLPPSAESESSDNKRRKTDTESKGDGAKPREEKPSKQERKRERTEDKEGSKEKRKRDSPPPAAPVKEVESKKKTPKSPDNAAPKGSPLQKATKEEDKAKIVKRPSSKK